MRLREVIKDLPKPMAPVAGRPFLEYLILQLAKFGINDIVLSVGYKKELIKSYFRSGESLGVNISYSEEDEPLGTGGAIKKAAQLIDDESMIAMNGDSFLDLNFDDFISFYKNTGVRAALALAYVEDTARYGRVETGENSVIKSFSEKGQSGSGLINSGVYLFSRDVINGIAKGNVSVESDVFPGLVNQGLCGMSVKGFFIDMGLPEDYLKVSQHAEILNYAAGIHHNEAHKLEY